MSASNIPYLGSKISLVSKSEIRYEGVLYTIDPLESTVALAKVRSFGTEDRPTDRPVGPRDEVYEYIIFRGKDIKDIRVCGPPKPQPTLTGGLPNDPAIVQHSAPTTSGGPGFQGPPYSKPSSFGPIGAALPGGAGPQFQNYGASPMGPSAAPGAPIIPGAITSLQITPQPVPCDSQPLIDIPSQPPTSLPSLINDLSSSVEMPQPEPAGSPLLDQIGSTSRSGSPSNSSVSRKSPTIDQGVQVSHNAVPKEDNKQSNIQRKDIYDRFQQPQYYQQGARGGFRGYRGGRGDNRNMRRSRGGIFSGDRRGRLNFKEDYDFDNANQAFEEIKSKLSKTTISDESPPENVAASPIGSPTETEETKAEENKPAEIPHDDGVYSEEQNEYYDKDGFFDKISCEALERSKGKFLRTDWRQERKLNAETFGISEYPRRMGYRGGYRGGFMMRNGGFGGFNRGFRGMRGGRGAMRGFNFQRDEMRNASTPRRGTAFWGRRGRGNEWL